MVLSPWVLKSLNRIERTKPRMMCATFNGNPNIIIIFCHSPTNEEQDITSSYNELLSFAQYITEHNVLIIINADMDAQIDKNKNKFCLHNLLNRNGKYFSFGNSFSCLYTKFQTRCYVLTFDSWLE